MLCVCEAKDEFARAAPSMRVPERLAQLATLYISSFGSVATVHWLSYDTGIGDERFIS